MITTALDLAGALAIAAFAWFVWPPLVLLVLGAAALLISWQLERKARPPQGAKT